MNGSGGNSGSDEKMPLAVWASLILFAAVLGFVAYIQITAPSEAERAAQARAEAEAREAERLRKIDPAASDFSIERYSDLCWGIPADIFDNRCVGKWIVWDVFISEVRGLDKIGIKTAVVGGRMFAVRLSQPIDWDRPLSSYVDMKVRLAGKIDDDGFFSHDLTHGHIVKVLDTYTADEITALGPRAPALKEATRKAVAYQACAAEVKRTAAEPFRVRCPAIHGYTVQPDGNDFRVTGTCDRMISKDERAALPFACKVFGDGTAPILDKNL